MIGRGVRFFVHLHDRNTHTHTHNSGTVSHKVQSWWRQYAFEKRIQHFEKATTTLQIKYRKLLFRRKMARVECEIVRAKAMLRAVSARAIYAKRRDLRCRVNIIKRAFTAYHHFTTWSRTAYSIERLEDVRTLENHSSDNHSTTLKNRYVLQLYKSREHTEHQRSSQCGTK